MFQCSNLGSILLSVKYDHNVKIMSIWQKYTAIICVMWLVNIMYSLICIYIFVTADFYFLLKYR